jgi:zeta-carotene desaturase
LVPGIVQLSTFQGHNNTINNLFSMLRFFVGVAVALLSCCSFSSAFAGGHPQTTRRSSAILKSTVLRSSVIQDGQPAFTSEGAQRQVGNDAFLNKNLMSRAQNGPGKKNENSLRIGIVGAGLAGMVAAMDLADAGHQVELFETRPIVGGKVSSWKDKQGNHIEMGLHVFFGCYYNLFGIMKRTGGFDKNLRIKDHIHTFVNAGGKTGSLDFRFPIGAPISGLQAFARTEQLGVEDKFHNAVRLGTSPIVRALIDFDGALSARCRKILKSFNSSFYML